MITAVKIDPNQDSQSDPKVRLKPPFSKNSYHRENSPLIFLSNEQTGLGIFQKGSASLKFLQCENAKKSKREFRAGTEHNQYLK